MRPVAKPGTDRMMFVGVITNSNMAISTDWDSPFNDRTRTRDPTLASRVAKSMFPFSTANQPSSREKENEIEEDPATASRLLSLDTLQTVTSCTLSTQMRIFAIE